jgi:transcriptional regulator with XRE-family HTH domain
MLHKCNEIPYSADMQSMVRVARNRVGLTRSELAQLAGVSASTVGRIESGAMSPTIDMLDRLLQAASAQRSAELDYMSDPAAIFTARALLDPDQDITASQEWIERFRLLRLIDADSNVDSPAELARRSSRFAPLESRPGIRQLERANTSWQQIASSLRSSGTDWCATGVMAANQLGVLGDEMWPVFYVFDIDIATSALDLNEFTAPGRPVALIPYDGMSEVGAWVDPDGYQWAAPLQVLMDCFAGSMRMPQVAEALAEKWDLEVAA